MGDMSNVMYELYVLIEWLTADGVRLNITGVLEYNRDNKGKQNND